MEKFWMKLRENCLFDVIMFKVEIVVISRAAEWQKKKCNSIRWAQALQNYITPLGPYVCKYGLRRRGAWLNLM